MNRHGGAGPSLSPPVPLPSDTPSAPPTLTAVAVPIVTGYTAEGDPITGGNGVKSGNLITCDTAATTTLNTFFAFEEVLRDRSLPLATRTAVACMYLPTAQLKVWPCGRSYFFIILFLSFLLVGCSVAYYISTL